MWTNDDRVHVRKYVSPGINVLTHLSPDWQGNDITGTNCSSTLLIHNNIYKNESILLYNVVWNLYVKSALI